MKLANPLMSLLINYSDLNFSHHIYDFVTRAKQRSSLIFRSFMSLNVVNLKRAFIAYLRPLLEYASPVWSPSHIYLINEIESVQRSFTKRLPGMRTLSYSDRLDRLDLQILEYRRLIADRVLYYNKVHGLSCINVTLFSSHHPIIHHCEVMIFGSSSRFLNQITGDTSSLIVQ